MIELKGRVWNFPQPSAAGSYDITIHPQDAASALQNASLPAGDVTLTGSVRYQQQDNLPPIRALALDGVLRAHELTVSTNDLNAAVRNIHGEFQLLDGNLDVHGLQADLLGGRLTAAATLRHLDTNSIAKVHASAQSISVRAANAAFRTLRLDPMPLDGQISGTADAAWTAGIKNIAARSEITLKGALTRARSASVPVAGAAHLNYDGRSATMTVSNTAFHTPQTHVEMDGVLGTTLNLKVQARAADLSELDTLATAFEEARPERPASISPPRAMNFLTCIDVARKFPGSLPGAYNTVTQVGSFLSGVVFGYVTNIFGSYDLALILTAFVLGFGALIWLKIDPTQELVPEGQTEHSKA